MRLKNLPYYSRDNWKLPELGAPLAAGQNLQAHIVRRTIGTSEIRGNLG
jgi:hypothetical protein